MYLGIDGTNWMHQLWHAVKRNGHQAIYDLANRRIDALCAVVDPSHVLVCWDRRSYRADLFPQYKATRPRKNEELRRLIDEAPGNLDIPVSCYQDGFEADDCLATLAAIATATGERCVIASGDKDLYQCVVAGSVTLCRRFKTDADRELVDPVWMTEAALRQEKLVSPAQWPVYQALLGEPGDNIPGCPGWGEKLIATNLPPYVSPEAMLQDRWRLQASKLQIQKLELWSKDVWPITRQLVTLRTDVPAVADALRA